MKVGGVPEYARSASHGVHGVRSPCSGLKVLAGQGSQGPPGPRGAKYPGTHTTESGRVPSRVFTLVTLRWLFVHSCVKKKTKLVQTNF